MFQGGAGTNDVGNIYTVSPIGIAKAEKIVYCALTTYMIPSSTFLDARQATILAAHDLYSQVEANAVASAWDAGNVGNTPTANITEAEFNKGIIVYPNPATTTVQIDVNISESFEVLIYDMQGKEIYQKTLLQTGNNSLDTSGIQSGIYIMKFTIDNSNFSKKLLIK